MKKIFTVIEQRCASFLERIKPSGTFAGSREYWERRYNRGRNSGDGSYGVLAKFKAEIINGFVQQEDIQSVIEYGCGDGNQLKLAQYPKYTGFDVSARAVSLCHRIFSDDPTKKFQVVDDYNNDTAELTLSLDVIYHLVEDEIFENYMNRLFDSSKKFVIIYASDTEANIEDQAPHVRHRKFSSWVRNMKPEWRLIQHIPNKYPYSSDTGTGSLADFFIYTRH